MSFKKIILLCVIELMNLPLSAISAPANEETTYSIHYPDQVKRLMDQADQNTMWENLKILTSFPNRSASTPSGYQAEEWIRTQLIEMINQYGRQHVASVETVPISAVEKAGSLFYDPEYDQLKEKRTYIQSSIMLKIEGSSEPTLPAIVVGAHMDTVEDPAIYKRNEGEFFNSVFLLPDNAMPNSNMGYGFSLQLQKKENDIIAYWPLDTVTTPHSLGSRVLSLEDIKNAGLENIFSLFPANGTSSHKIIRPENVLLLDGIAALCGFTHPIQGGIYPGADDDGSGAVTLLETARTLLASGKIFKRPIYLIWYAAEEDGCQGSKAVVNYFKEKNIPVEAIMQLDQTGFVKASDSTIYLDKSGTDPQLTDFLKELTEYYIKQPVDFTRGGLGSDHESWLDAGFTKVVRPGEHYEDYDGLNPYTHSPEDTMDKLSLSHMTDYLRLVIAFTAELAEPLN